MGAPPWTIEQHDILDSTNTRAALCVRDAFAHDQPIDRTAILAARQSAGRGQHGRAWESPPGGLYLSAIIEDVVTEVRPFLPLIAGVTVVDALAGLSRRGAIVRWPNDVLLGGRKIAGVLCESISQGKRWAGIIGIGVNVHVEADALPHHLQQSATSLHLHPPEGKGAAVEPIARVREIVLFMLSEQLMRVRSLGVPQFLERVRKLDALRGKSVDFQIDDRRLNGIARGIGEAGELLIDIDRRREAFSRGTLLAVDGVPLRTP